MNGEGLIDLFEDEIGEGQVGCWLLVVEVEGPRRSNRFLSAGVKASVAVVSKFERRSCCRNRAFKE